MKWRELGKYQQGISPEGHARFAIPLKPDEDGMVGRECPSSECQPRYFKIAVTQEEQTPDMRVADISPPRSIFCPYCGHRGDNQQFLTKAQHEYVLSLIRRDVIGEIQNMMANAFRPRRSTRRDSLITINISYKPGPLPNVRHYVERNLKRAATCDQCNSRYAVYGIATFCPFCGSGAVKEHLLRSASIIEAMLSAKADIENRQGSETGYHLLGNCLEDCVSLFEGFMKKLYSQALAKLLSADLHKKKIASLGNSFQNLSKSEQILRADLNLELFSGVSEPDRRFLELQFAKRHLITHNLSEVDERFRKQVKTWQDSGEDIDITETDIAKALQLVKTLLINIMDKLAG